VSNDNELYTEPLLGYRIWSMATSPISLTGIVYTSVKWTPKGPTHATCMRRTRANFSTTTKETNKCEHPPEMKCNDGMFAFYDLERMKSSGLPFTHTFFAVRGSVQGWGKIILHEDGYRAEYAQPIAIIDETEETIKKWVPQAAAFLEPRLEFDDAYKMRRNRVKLVAQNYGLPIIPEDDIEEFSRNYGAMPQV
jgi:hypothetical protein